jgi:hypothetical protein
VEEQDLAMVLAVLQKQVVLVLTEEMAPQALEAEEDQTTVLLAVTVDQVL